MGRQLLHGYWIDDEESIVYGVSIPVRAINVFTKSSRLSSKFVEKTELENLGKC